ncbi:MAG: MBL fold metallo-hydrolase [Pseudomonadales bacterium]|nr:MBL fold metallo-hydrolase [Pseudomonadales bacterium]
MLVTFYGVRGSIASPGPSTIKYGGNTSCMHVRLNSGENLIFDAGTGIRKLGLRLAHNDEPLVLLLSHGHWDHIQGYPFFEPIYQKDREIKVLQGVEGNAQELKALLTQMDGSYFPVQAADLPSRLSTVTEVDAYLAHRNFRTERQAINHPGGGFAYRVEEDGVSFAYVTDNELFPPGTAATSYDQWVAFCEGVDLLVHDAQYEEADMPGKHGWGHSMISQVRKLAVDARVKNLVMFHHDPERTDGQLDEIALASASYFRGQGARIGSWVAAEGLVFNLRRASDPLVKTIEIDRIE